MRLGNGSNLLVNQMHRRNPSLHCCYYYGVIGVKNMEEITIKLKSKDDLIRIIGSLIKDQTLRMTTDEAILDLTADLFIQSAGILTPEDVEAYYKSK